jgi:hypothetical protein
MKKFYVLFMVLVLGSLLAACSASTANITSAELGTGVDSSAGKATGVTTTFGKTAPGLHCVVTVANAPSGTVVKTTWTIVDAVDLSGNPVKDTKLKDVDYTFQSDGWSDFNLTPPSTGEWPVGSYKVDIYLNDKLDRTLTFTVK